MDPYVYPGTSFLRYLRDIRAPERLARFEADATSGRISGLEEKPVTGPFDSRHLQTIHHYIFQDVYPWAGEFRTVNISRPGGMLAFQEFIVPSINKAFGELEKERYLSGADLKRFSNRAAYYMGEINAVHSFREGNGRMRREFIRQLAQRNGYALNVYLEIPELAREQKGNAAAWIVSMYPGAVMKVFSGRAESAVKQLINTADVRELGLKSQGEMTEQFTPAQRLAHSEILSRHAPYVVLFRDGVLEGVVDRLELSTRMAAVLLR